MEYLNGLDLDQVLAQRGQLPLEEAVEYLLQAMEAVADAHAAGIVHRDLKPSNLFVTTRADGSPLVKVLDFGISKAFDATGPKHVSLTATSMTLGSPLYMSPEQVRSSKTVDARTDVWALGIIAYELLAGVQPFEAETVTGLCAKIVADEPVPLRAVRPDVPPAFEAVVLRCLEKNPASRYQSVAELAAALRPFASPEGRASVARIARTGGGSKPTLVSAHDRASQPDARASQPDARASRPDARASNPGPSQPGVFRWLQAPRGRAPRPLCIPRPRAPRRPAGPSPRKRRTATPRRWLRGRPARTDGASRSRRPAPPRPAWSRSRSSRSSRRSGLARPLHRRVRLRPFRCLRPA